MANKMKPFKPDALGATREKWQDYAEQLEIPFLDYQVLLEWVDRHIDYANANGDSAAYGVFDGKSTHAEAVVEIVYTQRPGGNWLKMLSVKLSPALAPAVLEANIDKMAVVVDIFAAAVVGTLALTDAHNAKVVKLYGRNESLLKLLIALNERLKGTLAGKINSKMEGRWLVIKSKH